jgi:hypothetical protein
MVLKKAKRVFTPEQKVEFIRQIESAPTIKQGCIETNIGPTKYRRQWKKQSNNFDL